MSERNSAFTVYAANAAIPVEALLDAHLGHPSACTDREDGNGR
jgi:hypothetical protein